MIIDDKPSLESTYLEHYGKKGMKWGKRSAPRMPQPVAKKPIKKQTAAAMSKTALSKIQKDTPGTVKGGTPVWKTLFGEKNKATLDYIMANVGSFKPTASSTTKSKGSAKTVRTLSKSGKTPIRVLKQPIAKKPTPRAAVRGFGVNRRKA